MPFTDADIDVDESAEATTYTGGSEASLQKSPVKNTSTPNTDWCDISQEKKDKENNVPRPKSHVAKGSRRRPVMAVSSVDGKQPARRQMATMWPTSTRRLPVLMVVSIRGSPPSGNSALR